MSYWQNIFERFEMVKYLDLDPIVCSWNRNTVIFSHNRGSQGLECFMAY